MRSDFRLLRFLLASLGILALFLAIPSPIATATLTPSCLPAPALGPGRWTRLSYGNDFQAVAVAGNVLWAGGDGLVRLSLADGSHVRYTAEDGLISNGVTALASDGDGNLWIGTDKGVSVFDGSRWLSFGLVKSLIRKIVVDSESNKWFATDIGVIVLNDNRTPFNPADDAWVTLAEGYNVFDLALDGAGRAWFGLWVPNPWGGYDARGALWLDYRGTPFDTGDDASVTFSGPAVFAIATEGPNLVWFGASDGVWALDHRRTLDKSDDRWINFTTADGLLDNLVKVLVVDEAGRKWIAGPTYGEGVSLLIDQGTPFEKGDDRWVSFPPSSDGLVNVVDAILPIQSNQVWFVGDSGVTLLDHKGTPPNQTDDTWTTYRAGPSSITALQMDRLGYLWLGEDGLWVLDDRGTATQTDDRWQHFTTLDGLAVNSVSGIVIDAAGWVWVKTYQGVSVLDPRGTPFDKSDDLWTTFRRADGLPGDGVSLMAAGEGNTMWFYNPFTVKVLDHNGTLANRAHDRWQSFTRSDGLAEDSVVSILVNGRHVWFGHTFGHASHLDTRGTPLNKSDDVWVTYAPDELLRGAMINEIAVDCAGRVWFGSGRTSDVGVRWLDDRGTPDKADDIWVTFSESDGLVENRVNSITPRGSNQVWFTYVTIRFGGASVLDHRGTSGKGDDHWQRLGLDAGWYVAFDPLERTWVWPWRFAPYTNSVYLPLVLKKY